MKVRFRYANKSPSVAYSFLSIVASNRQHNLPCAGRLRDKDPIATKSKHVEINRSIGSYRYEEWMYRKGNLNCIT